jgi:uncharacterized protein
MPETPETVADASPLILLAKLGHFDLLREFHGSILLAPAVWREVVTEGEGRAGSREAKAARKAGWLRIVAPQNHDLVRLLKLQLDDGEAETIALALELQAGLVLLDEANARRVADVFGLRKTGVVGLLIRAKLEGSIASLRDELTRLREEAGFRIAERLYELALEAVNENHPR